MKTARILVLSVLVLGAPCAATAQVSVNPAALQQLAGIKPAPAAIQEPLPAPVRHRRVHRHEIVVTAIRPEPVVEKPVATPPKPAAAPAPAPVAPKPIEPVTIIFAPGSSNLPPGAVAALKPLCGASGMVGIDARAPADKSDPSAAMRLSLARAIAVQSVLVNCGVAPPDVLARAQGAVPGANEDQTIVGMAK